MDTVKVRITAYNKRYVLELTILSTALLLFLNFVDHTYAFNENFLGGTRKLLSFVLCEEVSHIAAFQDL